MKILGNDVASQEEFDALKASTEKQLKTLNRGLLVVALLSIFNVCAFIFLK